MSTAAVAAAPEAPPSAAEIAAQRKAMVRQAMLSAPVLPTLFRMALPTTGVLLAQTLVSVLETFYVGFLGETALAGVALVFPVSMLMTMTAGGGIGGGVGSSIARAIGAGRARDADALVTHALALAVGFGLAFSAVLIGFGPPLYRTLGGHGPILSAALVYSAWTFAAAAPIWIVNLMSSALRGAGNVRVPALVTLSGAAVLIPLSPLLIFGLGPFKGFGLGGAGLAVAIYYTGAALALLAYMRSGRGGLVLRRVRLEGRLFWAILRVGLLSALSALQLNLTVILLTGAVGTFGLDALAAYGLGARLDYLITPILMGLGTALLTMVGANLGAGQLARARRITWTGVLVGAAIAEAIGLTVAIFPGAWIGLFTHDRGVMALGEQYLRTVAPVYGALGLIVLVNMASQGGGRPVWPLLAGTARMAVAAGGGWFVVAVLKGSPGALYAMIAASAVTSAALCLAAMGAGLIWRKGAQ